MSFIEHIPEPFWLWVFWWATLVFLATLEILRPRRSWLKINLSQPRDILFFVNVITLVSLLTIYIYLD
jgi:glucan phosphoethanolaminetransferase (alkaline phosphatase superfamily)